MSDRKKIIDFVFIGLFLIGFGLLLTNSLFFGQQTPIKETLFPDTTESTASALANVEIGPCTDLPVLIYHHIQDKNEALKKEQGGLTVDIEAFRKHIEYLTDNDYHFVTPKELTAFFDYGARLPENPVMITFDDGYSDNYSEAYPIMKDVGAKGVVFIPTGLMNNPDYLTWGNISEMQASGLFEFGNHTWSHMNVGAIREIVEKEIVTADRQLQERGLNGDSVFAYPYGLENEFSHSVLRERGYKLAFTTRSGRIMCRGQRLSLPRVRVGDSELSFYGL